MDVLQSEYFEISLVLMGDKQSYTASRDISKAEGKYVWVDITDENGQKKYFTSAEEFLNFMAAAGYDMADQIKSKSHTDYTFKRKN